MGADDRNFAILGKLLAGVQRLCLLGLTLVVMAGFMFWIAEASKLSTTSTTSSAPSKSGFLTQPLGEALNSPSPIRAVLASPDGQYVDTLRSDLKWQRFDAHTGRELDHRRIGSKTPALMTLSAGGVVIAAKSGVTIEVSQDRQTLRPDQLQQHEPGESVGSIAVSRNRNLIAAISDQGSLWLLEFDDEKVVSQRHYRIGKQLEHVAVSSAGDRVALMTVGARLMIWDVNQERIVAQQEDSDGSAGLVRWSGDGRSLISFGIGSEARIWRADTLSLMQRCQIDFPTIGAAELSSDGKLAAVADAETIRIWNVPAEQEIAVLTGHAGMVAVLHFADDGRTLFSGDLHGELRRWSLIDGREIWTIQ